MKFFLVLFFSCWSFYGVAQSSAGNQAIHPKVVKAYKLVGSGKPEKAIALLEKAYAKDSLKTIGRVIVEIHQKQENRKALSKWINEIGLDESLQIEDVLFYTQFLMEDGNYNEALKKLLNYAQVTGDYTSIEKLAYANEALIKAQKKSVLFAVYDLPFNTAGDEIAITNYRRQYVLTTNGLPESKSFDHYYIYQIYDQWQPPFLLLRNMDSKKARTNVSYSYDGNYVYYTEYLIPTQKKEETPKPPIFNIYKGLSQGNEWIETELFPYQKEGFSYKDAALHPNGKTLVFASNQNGNGHFDLYISNLENNQWSVPKPLSKSVNTIADEIKPYFDKTGKLFFASNNTLGFGGYDLYKTDYENGIWLKPEILPPPINSKYDETSIAFNGAKKGGFFISNRPNGKGGYDVYGFKDFNLRMSVSVVNKEEGGILPYAEVSLWKNGVLLNQKLTNENGEAFFQVVNGQNYTVSVAREGFQKFFKEVAAQNKKDGELFFVNVPMLRDETYIEASVKDSIKFNNQNFIQFEATMLDDEEKPLANQSLVLYNIDAGKIKYLVTDENGVFKQLLYIDNYYKIEMNVNGKRYQKVYNTIGLKPSKQQVQFILD